MMDLNQYMQRAQRGVYTNAMTAFALLLSLASTALVAQDAGKPAFTSHRVTQSTAMLEPADTNGNVGVFFGDEAVLLIDSHYERNVEALVAEVAEANRFTHQLCGKHAHSSRPHRRQCAIGKLWRHAGRTR